MCVFCGIGSHDLQSASIVFDSKIDGNRYKIIKSDPDIDSWEYHRTDGSCIYDSQGYWQLILDADYEFGQAYNNQYLFDLTNDISEINNLFVIQNQMIEQKNNNNETNHIDKGIKLINKINDITNEGMKRLKKYLKHPLFSEPIECFWDKLDIGMPDDNQPVQPFLNKKEYFNLVKQCFTQAVHDGMRLCFFFVCFVCVVFVFCILFFIFFFFSLRLSFFLGLSVDFLEI